ncbi:SNF2-related protein [Acetobacterium sp. KB-1]|jgi:ERCC4-related helicase|uniref:SNF2-related protein n=1 Tax=Acetobacterium sp. KB-1 TaxID=2184575 RepID=UPI000DBEB5A7|nr:SNF2-related protein [Acetobacterium sp. KB-1]AWW25978.1 DEAD/DEAH box helicase [Acetobacterium sp. KB-1]
MGRYTPHQTRYFAEQIMLKRPQSGIDGLASSMSGVKVDLNPHQVDAALFALKSPLSNGSLLADEVGLGKTIEAGLVLAQFWSERKRRILLIVPASLRTQWRAELDEKFYIKSTILESTKFNKLKKSGVLNPFEIKDEVVICSYNFASLKENEVYATSWDLVIIDEAHRLRNVYKSSNIMGKRLKRALSGKRKLLLTATPLQNNLMELYGLVSIIDEHVFGDARTFRDMYVSVSNEEIRNLALRTRLRQFCKRTLRNQVTEYVNYTNRIAILQEYTPTDDEEKLYNLVSSYLQTERLFALPQGQRALITLVLRKLLASSSFAISGTLNSLIDRLEALLKGLDTQLEFKDDYDTFDELVEEQEESDNLLLADLEQDRASVSQELDKLRGFAELAKSITNNSKGDNLLIALQKGFDETEKRGGQRKAVIFTESRRTQEYLLNLLSNHGYSDDIVFLNGTNNDAISRRIYTEWKDRHKHDGIISGSRQADMKTAVVEEFRDRASILIGTEAAAEGINLQFCSLIVNYDLPWNPQRIEQRIGRCHRYGQKNDVVVINFLNRNNAADVRVFELLDQKFRLFSGLFGSSDDVLGSIESGIDFEKRIARIYQTCKSTDEIQGEFDQLQKELSEHINEKIMAARQSILENFDEEVAARLKGCQEDTLAGLDKFTRWLCNFFIMKGAERVKPLDQWRFSYRLNGSEETYNVQWKDAERQGDIFLRREDPMCQQWLSEAIATTLPLVTIRFDHTNSPDHHISFLEKHPNLSGVLSVDKLIYSGFDTEEHLIISIVTDDGTLIDDDMINRIMELPSEITDEPVNEILDLDTLRKANTEMQKFEIERINKEYFLAECEKLDAFSEDLKEGIQRELKDLNKEIKEKKRIFKASTDKTLAEMLEMKEEVTHLEEKRKKLRREIYDREDEIDTQNERLQEEIRAKLEGAAALEHIMTISFEIV